MNCKLVGNFVQHLEVVLAPNEEFYVEKGSIIYIESGIEKEISFNGSGLGRIIGAKLSGESLFIIKLSNQSNRAKKFVIGGLFPLLLLSVPRFRGDWEDHSAMDMGEWHLFLA